MRTLVILFILIAACFASASIKDPRKNVKLSPELGQDVVGRQQAGQHAIGQVGGVPERTDDGGYLSRADNDADAAGVIAGHDKTSSSASAEDVLQKNDEAIKSEALKPRKSVFNLVWAVLGGLVLAFGVWIGLSKYGPQPPEHLAK
jgi:hypothetical protein